MREFNGKIVGYNDKYSNERIKKRDLVYSKMTRPTTLPTNRSRQVSADRIMKAVLEGK